MQHLTQQELHANVQEVIDFKEVYVFHCWIVNSMKISLMEDASANLGWQELEVLAFRDVGLINIGMEHNAYAMKELLELVELVGHAHLAHSLTLKRLLVCARVVVKFTFSLGTLV